MSAALVGSAPTPARGEAETIAGRIVAIGVASPTGISPVGTFHPGGPIRDKPEFAAFTEPGKILDPERILVTSASNYGAPLADPDRPAGAVLSLDPRGTSPVIVPPDFARDDGQASTADGRARVYTSQSPWFLNRSYNPAAVTADLAPVSAPTALSLNNAFGRVWITNAPSGLEGDGTESVDDPDGRPLAGAPSARAGGVFAGHQADRDPQSVAGSLGSGLVGTALLGKSPDGGGRAVFAAVGADGSLVQVHVEKGVDGLAPPGTIRRLSEGGAMATHAGVVFNWVPDAILYVADPAANGLVAVRLIDDGTVFRVEGISLMAPAGLNVPIDIAPAVPEVANPAFSSNTTLAGGSDLYVANRGDGTIARVSQNGTVVAVRGIVVPEIVEIGAGQVNGIAVSPDASKLWVTLTAALPSRQDSPGLVVELPAFGATAPR